MSAYLEYQETVRAVSDRIVTDIYKLRGTRVYVLEFYFITGGRKVLITKKELVEKKGYDYSAIKDEIREKLFLEAYNMRHN